MTEWIRAARTNAGFTMERLGEALGRTKANVHAWEKGLHEPSFSQVMRIARVTKFSLFELDEWVADGSARINELRSVDLGEALEVLGSELAEDMPDDIRQDAADLLAKLAHRRGEPRHQQELLTLLTTSRPASRNGTEG